ncbi:MAG: formate dehydrogenase accessory protein FdhE [Gemmatimonadota bacterium]
MRYPERERRRIAALRRERSELGEVLSFLERVAEAAGRFFADGFELPRLRQAVVGSPPLLPGRFPIDEAAAAKAFRAFLEAFLDATGSEAAKKTMTALREDRLDPRRLVRAYCSADTDAFEEAGRQEGLDAELLVNLAELALKPQFIAAAQALEKETEKAPDRSDRCPACGSPPDLALITDRPDAKHTMVAICRLCESEWPIRRVRCLHCGNEDSDTLSYLKAEGEDEGRVSICELCRRYLLVLDVRGRLDVAPGVERAALVHLDIVAQKRGARPLTVLLGRGSDG